MHHAQIGRLELTLSGFGLTITMCGTVRYAKNTVPDIGEPMGATSPVFQARYNSFRRPQRWETSRASLTPLRKLMFSDSTALVV